MTSVHSCGGWNRTNGLLVQSQASHTNSNCPARISLHCIALPSDPGRRSRTFVSWFKARQHAVSPSPITKSVLRESNPPRQLGRLAPLPLGQGHVSKGGRRG